MAYSIAGILAVFIHLIINIDVFFTFKSEHKFPGQKYYGLFLVCVIAYHITDGFWGFLYDAKLTTAVFADTVVYFFTMAASILLWGIFVYHYLGLKNKTSKAILISGIAIFIFQTITIIVNFFHPILFSLSEDCIYSAEPARYAILAAQLLVYILVSVYTFVSCGRAKDSTRRRLFTIGVFGLFMAVAITLQTCFPLLPMYTIGYLFGICVLHTFVIHDEITNREHELDETKHRISTDPLTGVYSKHAYIDAEYAIEGGIAEGSIREFAIVVFDINDLKKTNDAFGHQEGDLYIKECTELIEEHFKDVKIYRVGGDEFAAILEGGHYQNRSAYLDSFNKQIDANLKSHSRIIVSAGIADYLPDKDSSILQVFTRADREMYARKQSIKEKQSGK